MQKVHSVRYRKFSKWHIGQRLNGHPSLPIFDQAQSLHGIIIIIISVCLSINYIQICYTNSYDWQTETFTSTPDDPSKFVEDFVLSVLECQQRISQSIRNEVQIYINDLQGRIDGEKNRGREYWVKRYTKLLGELRDNIDSIHSLARL